MRKLPQIFRLGCPELAKNGVRTSSAIGRFKRREQALDPPPHFALEICPKSQKAAELADERPEQFATIGWRHMMDWLHWAIWNNREYVADPILFHSCFSDGAPMYAWLSVDVPPESPWACEVASGVSVLYDEIHLILAPGRRMRSRPRIDVLRGPVFREVGTSCGSWRPDR